MGTKIERAICCGKIKCGAPANTGTKFGGGGTPVVERFVFTTGQEARAGKNYQKSASGFSRKKVRILFRTDSKQKARIFVYPVGKRSFSFGARPRFLPRSERKAFYYWGSAAEFRFLLRKKRRQRRCCPCPSPPVRGQRQGTPIY